MSPRPTCRLMRARQCETTARDDRRRRHVASGDENRREDHFGTRRHGVGPRRWRVGADRPRARIPRPRAPRRWGLRSGLPRATTAGGSGTGSCLFSTDARPTRNARAFPWSPPAGRLCSCFAPWARSCSAAARTRRRRRAPARPRGLGECDDRSDAAPVVSYSSILFRNARCFCFSACVRAV